MNVFTIGFGSDSFILEISLLGFESCSASRRAVRRGNEAPSYPVNDSKEPCGEEEEEGQDAARLYHFFLVNVSDSVLADISHVAIDEPVLERTVRGELASGIPSSHRGVSGRLLGSAHHRLRSVGC